MAEPARQALLTIDNPLIDEMVAALLDPVVARPLRQWVVELAVAGVAASGDGTAKRWWAQRRWAQAPPHVTQRLQRVLRRASAPRSTDRADRWGNLSGKRRAWRCRPGEPVTRSPITCLQPGCPHRAACDRRL